MREQIPDWILDLVPGRGDRDTVRRLRELQRRAGTLPIIFALLFTESIKAAIASTPLPIPLPVKFFIAALTVGVLYVYDDKVRRTKQAAEQAKDSIKDKIEKGTQHQITDYYDDS